MVILDATGWFSVVWQLFQIDNRYWATILFKNNGFIFVKSTHWNGVKSHTFQPTGSALFLGSGEYRHLGDEICLLGGFNPSQTYQSNGIISPSRGENQKYLKPPTRCACMKDLFHIWVNIIVILFDRFQCKHYFKHVSEINHNHNLKYINTFFFTNQIEDITNSSVLCRQVFADISRYSFTKTIHLLLGKRMPFWYKIIKFNLSTI